MMNSLPSNPRKVDYLRMSITDRCNERCTYCMPQQLFQPRFKEENLSFEEIIRIVRITTEMGFRKFRITGGEPTVRKGLVDFLNMLSKINGVESIGMTTNGLLLDRLAEPLKKAGLNTVNISLDALNPIKYRGITTGNVDLVLKGIRAAVEAGFDKVKLNTVLMKGVNENEIWPLLHFAAEHHLAIRFIELMPLTFTEVLTEKNFLPVGAVMKMLREKDTLTPIEENQGHGPAKYYRLEKLGVTVGFIGAITNLHFCDHCNKIRLTADGKIRPCLGNHNEIDLKSILRNGSPDNVIASLILDAITNKPPEHLFRNNYKPSRVMTAIGG